MSARIGSLFSGYGGLDLGVQAVVGGTVAWHVEFDSAPSKILAHHWPDIPNYGDITTVDWSKVPPVDILTGGFPCQDLSLAGRRAGMRDGTRSGLWSDYLKAIDTLHPGLVVIENVRGLLSGCAESDLEPCPGCVGEGEHRPVLRALGRVLGDLAGIGYDATWCGVRAADAGAPHGRFRIFILAFPRVLDSGHDAGGSEQGHQFDPDDGVGESGSGVVSDSAHDGHEQSGVPRPGWARSTDDGEPAEDSDVAASGEWGFAASGEAASGRAWADSGRRAGAPVTDSDDAGRGEHGRAVAVSPEHEAAEHGGADVADSARGRWAEGRGDEDGGYGSSGGVGSSELGGACAVAAADSAGSRRAEGEDAGSGGGHAGAGARGLESERGGGERAAADAGSARLGEHSGESSAEEAGAVEGDELADPERVRPVRDWGPYRPAIERWERVTGRVAPAPTNPDGKNGQHRLSAAFVEWMMGLPAGHVTSPEIGLTRNEQLKALGNGVVPQQAALALTHLLSRERRAT